jgi:hypothetical protein
MYVYRYIKIYSKLQGCYFYPNGILTQDRLHWYLSRVARFFLSTTYQNGYKIPNVHKIYAVNEQKDISNGHKLNGHIKYQHYPLQDPPKYTQIGIFGMQIYHLATLHLRR